MILPKFKITFVYPDFESLGIEYLMALCLQAGHEVELVYYQAENPYLGRKRESISFPEVAQRTIATNPDVISFSCVTDNYQYQLKCAQAVKKIRPSVITIFGGIHPTAVPKLVLREKAVDGIAIGEADISFVNFLEKCRRKTRLILPDKEIKGIVFKKGGKLIGGFKEGPLINLDTLPFPYKDVFFVSTKTKEPFFASTKTLVNEYRIITSRGCPYSCNYCFNSLIHKMRGKGFKIRQRSVDNVISELLWAKKKYKIKHVFFIDDSFTTDRQWVAEFSRKFKKKIGLDFACVANPEYLSKKVANLLKSAGCIFIQIGVQSLCKKISKDVLNRATTKEKITRGIRAFKEQNIMIQLDHMLGIPGDTIENQERAILYYNQHRPGLVSIFWLIYYPKTPIVQIALQKKAISLTESDKIEKGESINRGSIHDMGSMRNPGPFYSIQFLLNYLPFLPKWLIKFLVVSRWYRIFNIRNYYLSTAIPRVILSLLDKRYFIGRSYFIK